jgi:formylglycine-generating enzyme required for sulfatase activity
MQPPDLTGILPPPFSWCCVPSGKVALDDMSDAQPIAGSSGGTFEVDEFYIAKFPITNAQYDVFVLQAYDNPEWWDFSGEAAAWHASLPVPNPSGFTGNDLPRTQITWYDAIAFCRWLSAVVGTDIALPHEMQWQRAAQGDTGWLYPYGNSYRSQYSTVDKKSPTPVTLHPEGASPFGVMDMSGNVLEWCHNRWATGSSELLGAMHRCMRGGSFAHNEFVATTTFRVERSPENWKSYLGMRIIWNIRTA